MNSSIELKIEEKLRSCELLISGEFNPREGYLNGGELTKTDLKN